jgi:hypothetical protein
MSRQFSIYSVFDKLVKNGYDKNVELLFKNYDIFYENHINYCNENGLCVHGKKDFRCKYCGDGTVIPEYSYR